MKSEKQTKLKLFSVRLDPIVIDKIEKIVQSWKRRGYKMTTQKCVQIAIEEYLTNRGVK